MDKQIDRPAAVETLLVDDDKVRVTRFDFAPGAATGWHKHGMDYVVTPLTKCQMLLEEADGKNREVEIEAGAAYRRDSGVEHNVINNGAEHMSFVEVELKIGRNI